MTRRAQRDRVNFTLECTIAPEPGFEIKLDDGCLVIRVIAARKLPDGSYDVDGEVISGKITAGSMTLQ